MPHIFVVQKEDFAVRMMGKNQQSWCSPTTPLRRSAIVQAGTRQKNDT
jgi:hypothetical protein